MKWLKDLQLQNVSFIKTAALKVCVVSKEIHDCSLQKLIFFVTVIFSLSTCTVTLLESEPSHCFGLIYYVLNVAIMSYHSLLRYAGNA